jgi:hypothetical protein
MDTKTFARFVLVIVVVVFVVAITADIPESEQSTIAVPKVWNDREVSDWATPLAGLGWKGFKQTPSRSRSRVRAEASGGRTNAHSSRFSRRCDAT